MPQKKFILNVDGFGMSRGVNKAVLNGYLNGFLRSASLCANGKEFNAAVNEIIPECANLGIGVHLNITKGRALTKSNYLTNKKGNFNNNYFQILLKVKNKEFLKQVEFEFRTQIETIKNYTKIYHIDSYNHIHNIPEIFKITAQLAKEYKIPFIRTLKEEIYFVPSLKKHINFIYPANICKMALNNYFTQTNKNIAKKYNLQTNDYIIGMCYTNLMDNLCIECGLNILDENCVTEGFIHPKFSSLHTNSEEYKEYLITQNKELKNNIARSGFEITSYKEIAAS